MGFLPVRRFAKPIWKGRGNMEVKQMKEENQNCGNVPNAVIGQLISRRTIRHFTDEPIDETTRMWLERAAQQAPTSEYRNAWSAVRVTDRALAEKLAQIGGQPYIADAALLYLFVADQNRNEKIALGMGDDPEKIGLNSPYALLQGVTDAALAVSAMMTAADSLGLGCVALGSVLNNVPELIRLLRLPERVYPVLGLGIGHIAKSPSVKPRMPRKAQFFENTYPEKKPADWLSELADFDRESGTYTDLRHPDETIPPYFDSIKRHAVDDKAAKKLISEPAREQGYRI